MLNNLKYILQLIVAGALVSCGQNTYDSDLSGLDSSGNRSDGPPVFEVKVEVENASSVDFALIPFGDRLLYRAEKVKSSNAHDTALTKVKMGSYNYIIEATVNGRFYSNSLCIGYVQSVYRYPKSVFIDDNISLSVKLCCLDQTSSIIAKASTTKIATKNMQTTSGQVEAPKYENTKQGNDNKYKDAAGGRWPRIRPVL